MDLKIPIVKESKLFLRSDTQPPPTRAGLGRSAVSDVLVPYAPNRWSSVGWLVLVGLAAALLCAPFFRLLFDMSDEGILLHGADLLLQGKKLYADFFQFLPPGVVVLTAAWFKVAGVSFGSARLLALATMVGGACFTFLACRQASRNAPLSAFLAIAWVMMSAFPWMQISHHWFAMHLSMVAAWAALASLDQPQRQLRWPLIAGAASGGATMFVPHTGALTALAAMTVFLDFRQRRGETVAYVLGCALAPAAALGYLLEQHTLVPAYEDIVGFTTTRYSSINLVRWGLFSNTLNRPLKYVFQITATLTLVVCAYDWRASLSDSRLRLCAAFAIAGFLSCFPRPDIVRISSSAPLTLPLLAFCLTRLTQSWRPAYRYAGAALMIVLCLPCANAFRRTAREALSAEVVPTPRGSVALLGPFTSHRGFPELLASVAATPHGDAYFFYPHDAILPFLTGREHVSKYDLLVPGYTTPAQYEEACRTVMRHASWLVVDRQWTDDLQLWKVIFPGMRDPEPKEAVRFQQALDSAFPSLPSSGTFQLRHRREGVGDAACDGIAEE